MQVLRCLSAYSINTSETNFPWYTFSKATFLPESHRLQRTEEGEYPQDKLNIQANAPSLLLPKQCAKRGAYFCELVECHSHYSLCHSSLTGSGAIALASTLHQNMSLEELKYRRIRLSGTHRYLAHTAYQAHTVLLTKAVQTLDKKHTALIKQEFGVGKVKYSTSGQVRGSANEGLFANNQWGSLL